LENFADILEENGVSNKELTVAQVIVMLWKTLPIFWKKMEFPIKNSL